MAYSTAIGLKIAIPDKINIKDPTTALYDTDRVAKALTLADRQVDVALISGGIPRSSLPLTNADDILLVEKVANEVAACSLLTGIYTEIAENSTAQVDRICRRAADGLDKLEAAATDLFPDLTGVWDGLPLSNTKDQDRVISYTRYSDGEIISDDTEGTCDDW